MDNRRLGEFVHPRFWPTWAALAIVRLASLLPLPLIRLLGFGVGWLVYVLHTSRRRITRRNIERCFPDRDKRAQRRLVRAHFGALGQAVLDNGIAWWGSARRLRHLVRIVGREHLEAALRARRSVILFTPHFMALEIAAVRLSLEGPMVTVFRHPDNELMQVIMWRGRARFGLKLIEHNKPFLSLVRAVKSGTPLYYLPDQDAGRRRAVFAPFFGIPASTFKAMAELARLTDAVVIPCIARQLPWGRGHEIVLMQALENYPTGDDVADATCTNAVIEEAARRWPEQYFWVHKRFKTRPEGEPDFYK